MRVENVNVILKSFLLIFILVMISESVVNSNFNSTNQLGENSMISSIGFTKSNDDLKKYNLEKRILQQNHTEINKVDIKMNSSNNSLMSTCNSDNDCKSMHICTKESNSDIKVCKHKNAFPLSFLEFFVYIFLSFSFGISILCGVGGGGVFTATIMWLQDFSTSEAVPLSVSIMFISAVMTFYMNSKFKDDNPKSDFVDYKLVVMLMPMILLGAKLGSLLNTMLPFTVTSTILLCFTVFVIKKNYDKYLTIHAEEERNINMNLDNVQSFKSRFVLTDFTKNTESPNKKDNSDNRAIELEDKLIQNDVKKDYFNKEIILNNDTENNNPNNEILKDSDIKLEHNENSLNVEKHDTAFSFSSRHNNQRHEINTKLSNSQKIILLNHILEEENNSLPWKYIKLLLINEAIVVLDLLIEGNANIPSIIGIENCSFMYWAVFFLTAISFYFLLQYFTSLLVMEYEFKKELDPSFRDKKLEHLLNSTDKVVILGLITGVMSGVLGIGGGLVLTPVLLAMGLSPKSTTTSCNLLIVFSSFTSSLLFCLMGKLYVDFAVVVAVPCIFSCYICSTVVNAYIKKTGRQSVLVLILTLTIAVAVLFLLVSMKNRIGYYLENDMSLFKFHSICTVKSS